MTRKGRSYLRVFLLSGQSSENPELSIHASCRSRAEVVEFNIQIKYMKKARRITIRVSPNQIVKVTAPKRMAQKDITDFINLKTDWILKQHRFVEEQNKKNLIHFADGQPVPFLGVVLYLKVVKGAGLAFRRDNDLFIPLNVSNENTQELIKKKLVKWYQKQALEKIQEDCNYFAPLLGVRPASIRLRNYRSRWGACSSKGELIFNWQIITFAEHLFKYVVAHELCHIKEMNHSSRFYDLLQGLGFDKKRIHSEMRYLRNLF
jgi:predicted metal-dependent hydrolase